MEPKGKGSLSNLLSKTAGLVFFAFLAISLGVVFGLLFEGWVQPGTPVGTDNNLQSVDLASDKTNSAADNLKIIDDTATKKTLDTATSKKSGELVSTKNPADVISIKNPADTTITKPVVAVKFKVRVGPYANQNEALAASQQLHSLGYPVYVANKPPFAVQVGAFATQNNADRLKNELVSKGYKVIVDQN